MTPNNDPCPEGCKAANDMIYKQMLQYILQ